MQQRKFVVDFDSIAGYYVKTFTIREITPAAATKTIVLTIRPPEDWHDIVFKQLNRSIYYDRQHYLLDWCDGDIDFDDWTDEVEKYIDFTKDLLFVNNYSKSLALQQIFQCINNEIKFLIYI